MIRCSRLFSHVIESCLICSETPGQRKGRIRDVVVNEGEANPHSSYIFSARGLGGRSREAVVSANSLGTTSNKISQTLAVGMPE